ncbi:hypothetical protein HNQ91_003099 [Filimonas zeae]|uniref:Uncharacterized protein n=1 Tax=Filimonas zeae TaxID=1737353 RepID=A0A917IYQ4_9BACT|nr:hypothetical protein [Filimonas zeae]MDR6340034.1 hypothetical protein [Filimonas zeae]GGH70833.1 hypothetical protein GCM10011379_29510 [Filimonas zeae]
MSFIELDLSVIKTRLATEVLNRDIHEPFHFLPDELIEYAKGKGLNVEVRPIMNWEEFEWGRIDFGKDDFRKIVFSENGYGFEKGRWIYISDELLAIKKAAEFELDNFDQFVSYYEDMFKMDFFQPGDHIIISYSLKLIIIIHHDGYLIRIT